MGVLLKNFKPLLLPYLSQIDQALLTFFKDVCLKSQDFSLYLELLEFLKTFSEVCGASAFRCLQEVCFGDNDLNVCEALGISLRLVLIKCDKTEVSLQDNSTVKANNAFKNQAGTRTIRQYLLQQDPAILSTYCLKLLQFLENVTLHPSFQLVSQSKKAALE
jgi:hypothetical protein